MKTQIVFTDNRTWHHTCWI